MNASAIRKTNQFADCGQSSYDQMSDYFGIVALCDNHIDQNNDYSALDHYLDRQRIDTQCALISTGWTCRGIRQLRSFMPPRSARSAKTN
jgi:hypothetical protein